MNENKKELILSVESESLTRLDLSVVDRMKSAYVTNRKLAETSTNTYLMVGKELNAWLESNHLIIDENSLTAYFAEIIHSQAPATYNLKRHAIKKLLKMQPGIANNPVWLAVINELFTEFKTITENRAVYEDEYITQEDVKIMIANAPIPHALIIEFLFKTGLRVSEMTHIRLVDMDFDINVKIRVLGKGSKIRYVFADRVLIDRIRNAFNGIFYLFETRNGKPLHRVYVTQLVKKYGLLVGKNIHAHTMRHSCIMHLLKKHNIKYVSCYAGHSSTAITADMYVHENPGEEVLSDFDI